MQKPSLLMQIVIASSITIMAVLAVANATTIGTNISTSGTLTVTGATTLSGNNTFSGIATSTNALIASSTFRVFGTTIDGTGTFIESIAQGTDAFVSAVASGLVFKKADGTIWGSLTRGNAGGRINMLTLRNIVGDLGSGLRFKNYVGEDVIQIDTLQGIIIGDATVNTASNTFFKIQAGGTRLFSVNGDNGNVTSLGDLSIRDGSDNEKFAVDNGTGNTSIASSTTAVNLAVGAGEGATTTVDFAKPCFRMMTEDDTTLYYWPSLNSQFGWATSTTSCF